MPALELRGIEKRYGKLHALQGLDLCAQSGEVYGFLGRNGAGKSTAMRIVMGITKATSGEMTLFDEPRGSLVKHRQRIGYVAQEQNFYGWMTATRLGRFVAGFFPNWDTPEYLRLLKALEVPLDRKVDAFSGGMRAKLALALALAHRPLLLLLDEPTAGMDAVARREFIDIVRDQAARAQRTTVFSSHLIDEVERAADRVGIVDEGKMRYEGSLQALRQSAKRFVLVGDSAQDTALPGALLGRSVDVLRDEQRHGRREVMATFAIAPPANLWAGPWKVEQPSLEDIFIAMVSKTITL